MYIRLKKRRNNSGRSYTYAYLVKSKYRKKYPKQKILSYLGRVYEFNRAKKKEVKIKVLIRKDFKKIIKSLIVNELVNHGFKPKNKTFYNKAVFVDLENLRVFNELNKLVCIKLNDGYLCDYTLRTIFNKELPNATTKTVGKELAKRLIDAGIKTNPEIFLLLMKKTGLLKT